MLRWTEGNEAVEIAFVMFIFPLLMNGIQYWIIDNFIMDKSGAQSGGGVGGGEYERVGHDGDESWDGDGDEEVGGDVVVGKGDGEQERLVGGNGSEGSRRPSPGVEGRRKERDD